MLSECINAVIMYVDHACSSSAPYHEQGETQRKQII